MIPKSLLLLAAFGVFLAEFCSTSHAQEPVRSQATLQTQFEEGLRSLQQEATPEALRLFEQVYSADPGYVHQFHGAVAFHLGRIYHQAGHPQQAIETWAQGFTALQSAGLSDLYLANALVQRVYSQGAEPYYALAADAYLQVLAYLDVPLSAAEEALIANHLETLAMILPARTRHTTGLDRWQQDEGKTSLVPNAGAQLITWWRSQDTLPASRENERLVEHLQRVAYADRHYRHEQTGQRDDRAVIYIRLGTPPHKTSITFDGLKFRQHVLREIPTITSLTFPKNEFWIYPHIDRSAHYLFVKAQGQPYRLGEPNDLIPTTLQMGLGFTGRGVAKAEALIWTMDEMYRQLALYDSHYATRYNDSADYVGLLEDNEFLAEMDRRSTAMQQGNRAAEATTDQATNNEAKNQTRTMSLPMLPNVFAEAMIERAHTDDKIAFYERQKRVPPSYANLLGTIEPLEVAVRLVRFLDADGTTRTEINWSTSARALRPAPPTFKKLKDSGTPLSKQYLLAFSAAQKTADYQDRVLHRTAHLVDQDWTRQEHEVLAPQVYTLRGDTGRYHLALQWDQYLTNADEQGQATGVGQRIKAKAFRADTLTAINPDPSRLAMSDLKPMVVPDSIPNINTDAFGEVAVPYPFVSITPQIPLVLYFELYHLTFGADDRTHYTVTYEIKQRTEGSLLRLRKGHDAQIAATTSYTGSTRAAQEFIMLDLSAWEGTGALEIRLHVMDDVTTQQTERALFLHLDE